MGNLMGLCSFVGSSEKKVVVQVMRMNDGKTLEFRAPVRVRDLLVKYPNSYVGMFKEATQPLPLDYKLKIGNIYYLFPPLISTTFESTSSNRGRRGVSSLVHRVEPKRIKVVITRQQLDMILSNQMKLEDVIMEVRKKPCKPVSPVRTTCDLEKLESIPEEVEGVY